jgi:hypothetical protein
VEDEPLERLAALRDDQQSNRGSLRDERLLDGAPAGDELLVRTDETGIGRRSRAEGARLVRRAAAGRPRTAGTWRSGRAWAVGHRTRGSTRPRRAGRAIAPGRALARRVEWLMWLSRARGTAGRPGTVRRPRTVAWAAWFVIVATAVWLAACAASRASPRRAICGPRWRAGAGPALVARALVPAIGRRAAPIRWPRPRSSR